MQLLQTAEMTEDIRKGNNLPQISGRVLLTEDNEDLNGVGNNWRQESSSDFIKNMTLFENEAKKSK